jgi:hypothetical protein
LSEFQVFEFQYFYFHTEHFNSLNWVQHKLQHAHGGNIDWNVVSNFQPEESYEAELPLEKGRIEGLKKLQTFIPSTEKQNYYRRLCNLPLHPHEN